MKRKYIKKRRVKYVRKRRRRGRKYKGRGKGFYSGLLNTALSLT